MCRHPDRVVIDAAVVAGETVRGTARRYGISRHSLDRHKAAHLSPALATVTDEAKAGPRTAYDRLETLYDRLERQAETAESQGAARLMLMTSKELRQTLETLARMTGELDDRAQVNVLNLSTDPSWTHIRAVLMRTLAPYPDAREAVAEALASTTLPDTGRLGGLDSRVLPTSAGDRP